MKEYNKDAYEKLILYIRNDDKIAEEWLINNRYQELKEFWDAVEGVEKSFKWLMENNFEPLAAVVDAMGGNDKAKVFLLNSGNRELAAFVEASTGSQKAISWLLKFKHHGWVMVAKEIFDRDKKQEKNLFWSFLNFGNPFR